ncbi:hypothetical protein [Lactiplantibacillus herbarum]|uniref:hypothetical protein n=1 Tax=Lactiplantibacillus herbarum TaxID=1670446 RepID=UPI00064ED20C|nr:hypothetical protein [Lactiplantibacillus herbarum]
MSVATKKIFFYSCVAVLITLFLSLTFFELSKVKPNGSEITENKTTAPVGLQKIFFESTALNTLELNSKKQLVQWKKNNSEMTEAQFYGAYLGIAKNRIIFSGQNGYANAGTRSKFKVNSTVSVGDFQQFLDDIMVFSLIKSGKIKLNNRLDSYLPELKSSETISVRSFLLNGSNLVINKKNISKFGNTTSKSFVLKYLRVGDTTKQQVSADELLKLALITSITHKNYEDSFNDLIVKDWGLSDTRIIKPEVNQANDVIGYKYLKKKNILIQKNKYVAKSPVLGNSNVRMSLADLVLITDKVFKDSDYMNKYNSLFLRMVQRMKKVTYSSKGFQYSSNIDGQYLTVREEHKVQRVILVVENFPNKDMSANDLARRFTHILDIK